ncbi:MAG: MFS transporter [Colwellia sp.]|nr:MAG: MFS transporter [Colwellia sp.]
MPDNVHEKEVPRTKRTTAVLALIACQVGLHACMQSMRLATPLEILSEGYGELEVGILISLFGLAPALLAIPAGHMADRYGYHNPVRIAASLSLLAVVITTLQGGLVTLLFAASLSGAGSGFGMIAIQRTAGRMAINGTDRIKIFSWIALAPAIAGFFGPGITGVLIDLYGFRVAFGAMAVLPIATFFFSWLVPAEKINYSAYNEKKDKSSKSLFTEPLFIRLLIINWLVTVSWGVFSMALPILSHEREMSASVVGFIFMVYSLSSIVVRVIIPFVAKRLSDQVMLGVTLLLNAGVFVLFPFINSELPMVLLAAVLGVALGMIQPLMLVMLYQITPKSREGEALALRSAFVHVSMATMPVMFGVLGSVVGIGALFWLMATLLATGSMQARHFIRVKDPN